MSNRPRMSLQMRLFVLWVVALVALGLGYGRFFLHVAGKNAEQEAAAPQLTETSRPVSEKPVPPAPVPAFDADNAPYMLTVFSTEGVHRVTDAEPAFTLLKPGNLLVAQLIGRDVFPSLEQGKDAMKIRYLLDPAYAGGINAPIAQGELPVSPRGPFFASDPIAVMPYPEEGGFAPYPTAKVTAFDADGAPVAETRVVLPVSTEISCRNCHTGPWKVDGKAGISQETAGDILSVHDRRNGTGLSAQVKQGNTVICRSCHSGEGEIVNLSTAVHGFHATMKLGGAEACDNCHASAETGVTRFYRGFHHLMGLDCARCHGAMTDHALSLLRFEAGRGKKPAQVRMTQLQPTLTAAAEDIVPREPGKNLPHCRGCHDFRQKPDAATASAFNQWTEAESERYTQALDDTGSLRCPSCHGAPHAVHPAEDDRDNVQPLQYQKLAAPLGKDGNCAVCHTVPMEGFSHHELPE